MTLSGEGTYALSAVKHIVATDDFLGMNRETRKCQNEESYEDCITNQYLQTIELECNCVPYKLRDFSKEQVKERTLLPLTPSGAV